MKTESMVELILQTAKRYPDAIACSMGRQTWTYRQLMEDIRLFSAKLTAAGIRPYQKVAVALPNIYQTVVVFYALNQLHTTICMIHPMTSPIQFASRMSEVSCDTWITLDALYARFSSVSGEFTSILLEVSDSLLGIKKTLRKLSSDKKCFLLPSVINLSKMDGYGIIPELIPFENNETSLILFSSGTTGRNKAIVLSNESMNSLTHQMSYCIDPIPSVDSMLCILPLFHGFGLGVCLHTVLALGGRVILVPRFSKKNFTKAVLNGKPTYIAGVPELFRHLLLDKHFINGDLTFLKQAFCGGDRVSDDLIRHFNMIAKRQNSPAQLQVGYGSTETLTACCVMPRNVEKNGSIGQPLNGNKMMIYDNERDCESVLGEIGEILVSGPTLMKEYYRDPLLSKQILIEHNGLTYCHTRDYGYCDSDGYFYFSYRNNGLLKVKGYFVNPIEIEDIFYRHPNVSECQVICDNNGKLIAMISLKSPYRLNQTKKEIFASLNVQLDRWSLPKSIILVKHLPKNEVNKIDAREISRQINCRQVPLFLAEWSL